MHAVVNGIDLHWDEYGDGAPLLWLHGGMGCGSDWRFIFREPPEGFRLIAPDLRGHGASTNPSAAFTFRQCARDIEALLDRLGLPTVSAIGLSGGGLVLLHMATTRPDSLESMVLVSAPPYFPERTRAIQRRFSEAMLTDAERAHLRASQPGGEQQIAQLIAMTHGFAEDYDDVSFTPPSLSRISARTLIVFGDRDPLYPVSLALDLHQGIAGSFLWVVPNGGHGPVFGSHASRFAETAVGFLRGAWRE